MAYTVENIQGFVLQGGTNLYMSTAVLNQTDPDSVYYAGGMADVSTYTKVNDFSSIVNTGVNQDLLLFTTTEGHSLYLYIRNGYGYYFKTAPGGGYSSHLLTSFSSNMAGTVVSEFDIIFIESKGGNHAGNRGIAIVFKFSYSGATRECAFQWNDTLSTNINNWLAGSEIPTYTWRSWQRLAGNSGQFVANLPVIKPAIADQITPSDNQFLHTDDFTSLSNEASVWSTYLNALLGVEYTIAWSGNNRATLTVTNDPNEPRDKIFTFKFYLGAAGAPFATLVDDVRVGGTDPEFICSNYLLSIMYDQTNGVAAPVLLGYYAANTSYDYLSDAYTPWSQTTMENMYTWLQASANAPSGSGPYDTGTTDTGGTPTGGGHQDPMPNVNVPTLSGAASGMFTIYCPDDTELAQIATFLWSDNVLDNFKKYFNNFSDNIIALYVLPYKAANMPTKAFTVGKMTATVPAAVDYITTRFVSVEMGELTVGTRWDSYLDFEPYTKFNIYLPGIGVQALSADDIICPPNDDESLPIAKGSKLSLTYVLDLMTGNVAAYVKINGQIRYQFTGKVGYSIPLTGANYNSMVQGYVMATAGLIGTIASGGTAAPFAASAGAAGIINAMKPDVYRGGNLSGDSSALCLQYPYLIRRRPNKPYLKEQEIYTGFPSYMSGLLSEFSGFTQVIDAHVEGISCTEAERAEILQLLKSGVIL